MFRTLANFENAYEAIAREILAYYAWSDRADAALNWLSFWHLGTLFQERRQVTDMPFPRPLPALRGLASKSKHIRRRPDYVEIYFSASPIAALCSYLDYKFPRADIPALLTVHSIVAEQMSPLRDIKQRLLLVLAAGTFLLKSVPTSLVERVTTYRNYELAVFFLEVTLIYWLVRTLVVIYGTGWPAKRSLERIATVLRAMLSVRNLLGSAPPADRP